MCGSVRGGEGKNTKNVSWNDEVKAAIRRKEATWTYVFTTSDEESKERCMEVYREEKRKINTLEQKECK